MPAGRAAVSLSGTRPVIVETVPWMRRPDTSVVHGSLARYGGPDGHLRPRTGVELEPARAAQGGER